MGRLRAPPDAALSRAHYAELADIYDASCSHILGIRQAAIDALQLRAGETVLDVACGTGATLPVLARLVGATGRVIGIEHCPEMAVHARRRIDQHGFEDRASVIIAPVETVNIPTQADALLFCYTHDVLQSTAALANLFHAAKPGARIAVVGAKLVPWWFAPVNLWTCIRGRKYLTTFKGFSEPWKTLLAYSPDLGVRRQFHLGTSYLATGHYASDLTQEKNRLLHNHIEPRL